MILSSVDLARRDVEKGLPVSHYLNAIDCAAARGVSLANEVAGNGRHDAKQAIKPAEFVVAWCDEFRPCVPEGVEFRLMDSRPIPRISADPDELNAALLHLATNSLEAFRGWDGRKVIEVSLSSGMPELWPPRLNGYTGPEEIWITVSDSGPGISEEIQDRIFDVYFSTKGVGNSGLGLASVSRFAKSCGGRVDLISAPGKGAAFSLVFPSLPN